MQHLVHNRAAAGSAVSTHQAAPHEEAKLVRYTAGAIFDVVVDLRGISDVPGMVRHRFRLRTATPCTFRVGCAHGFLTLTDDSEVSYQISEPYVPEVKGFAGTSPAFEISWPLAVVEITERDATYPDFQLEGVGQP